MLYDILIIDDDFSGESVLDEMALSAETQDNRASWDNTIMPLYFGLTRKNLKVIWSTGELEDLEELDKSQLSSVKYIICDLHLSGIDHPNATNKTIVSKIQGILDALKGRLGDNDISFLVNSKYLDDHPKIEGNLQTTLDEKYPDKYTVEAFSEKNVITEEQKQELVDASLLSHIKERVIKKHLEVERCLDEKIEIEDDAISNGVLRELSFSSKHKIVKGAFELKGDNSAIVRLTESRNHIAHNEINSLGNLTGIKNLAGNNNKIFKKFQDLTDYLDKIDKLIAKIRDARQKVKNGII